MVNRDHVTTG